MTQGSTQGSTQGPGSDRSGRTTADTVLHLFGQQVRDAPQAYAVIAGADSLTYGQLDVRANRLAHHLIAGGLPPGAVAAIGTARRTEIVVALLAVLKAGGAYAVLDVEVPLTGQRQLAALTPHVLLTDAAHHARLDDGSGRWVVRLGAESAEIAGRPPERRSGPSPGRRPQSCSPERRFRAPSPSGTPGCSPPTRAGPRSCGRSPRTAT